MAHEKHKEKTLGNSPSNENMAYTVPDTDDTVIAPSFATT